MRWQLGFRVRLFTIFALCLFYLTAGAIGRSLKSNFDNSGNDSLVNSAIKELLSEPGNRSSFHFPQSVKRFYTQREFQPVWIKSDSDVKYTDEAMLILDCVLQFGLFHGDYHPDILTYYRMQNVKGISVSKIRERAIFDVMLTDAMLALINNLHYGKLNPIFTPAVLDKGSSRDFRAEDILLKAIIQPDFSVAILDVQPKSEMYILMQDYMKLLKGQYIEDCYEIPEEVTRRLAINLERLRWIDINENPGIIINIPSSTLKLVEGDIVHCFKLIIDDSISRIPIFKSLINDIVILSADKKSHKKQQSSEVVNSHPEVYFGFSNAHGVSLSGLLSQQSLKKGIKSFDDKSIQVQDAGDLAWLLLKGDNAGEFESQVRLNKKAKKTRKFILENPIPVSITYLTTEITEGLIVSYPDIYGYDMELEKKLYLTKQLPVLK